MDFKYTLDNLSIRKTTEADLDFVIAAENAEENAPHVVQWSREQHIAAFHNEDILHVILEADGRAVGYTILAGRREANRAIELRRIVIVEKGRGFGKAAIRLFKKLAFEELNAHRLWLDVREYNKKARELYLKMGFVEEGLIRDCILLDNAFVSHYIMSILEHEYRKDS
ncbi:MAG: family N-acetyltransferase [Clostridia bacterium]|nr:family N-acetyltransferase [Clostridia bacterium]